MLKNKHISGILKTMAFSVLFIALSAPAFAGGLRHVKEIMVAPPNLPIHSQIAKGGPVIIDVSLTTIEKNWIIDGEGTQISGMTYNGSNPGPVIVAHVGDYLQLTLTNPKSSIFTHNIDLHAATGALGSAALNKVKPGESVTVRFHMIKSGVFTYHCAPGGIMIPYHITQGMTGIILVLPRGGLTDGHGKSLHYDRAYYIGENDFYIPKDKDGNYKKYANASDAMSDTLEVMRGLIPTHMGFGGKAFAYTGKNALKAKVGENVLILHSQANNVSSPHLIGGHADYVWIYGGFKSPPVRDLQTWFIPAGGAVAAMYKFRWPGLYVYLNHNIIKAVMLGAAAHFKVTGKPAHQDRDLMQVIKKQHAI
jgi:nitrite reductase (NO-forming)